MADVTRILSVLRAGDTAASLQLAELLYDELRAIARREMAGERANHTLQPTALANEAYLRLVSAKDACFENRAHFFGAAAAAIRRVLVEHARKRSRAKRGADRRRVDLDGVDPAAPVPDEDVLALHQALEELATFDADGARIVELRFFAGMTIPEVAKLLEISESTVERSWRLSRAWLRGRIEDQDGR
jgi:RNA polymerase sigma factor (TIGR02999 family)